MVRVGDVLDMLNGRMPMENAEDYDNVGLLAGSRRWNVTGVLCALDMNTHVIDEAIASGANLILTHHPILFRGRKNLCEDDPEGRMLAKLVRANIAHIAMHTNFDCAANGVNDALAGALGLTDVEALESGMRLGVVNETTLGEFAGFAENILGGVIRKYGRDAEPVRRVAVMGGSGGDYALEAINAGADTFVTGEIGYHKALDAYDMGTRVLEAGHAATERPAVRLLVDITREICGSGIKIAESAYESFL